MPDSDPVSTNQDAPLPDMSLGELVLAIKGKPEDQNLWAEFFYRFGYLVRTQLRLHGSDLLLNHEKDVVQDACLKLICEFSEIEPERAGLQTYIAKIARSTVHDYRRHLRTAERGESSLAAEKERQKSDNHANLVDLWMYVCQYFPTLKDREIVKQVWAEATIPEISTTLGVSEYQVRRVRARLEAALNSWHGKKNRATAK